MAAVVLDLEHPDTRNIPLEVELDQRRGRRGLGRHHPLVRPGLDVGRHVAAVGPAPRGRGDVRGAGVGLLDVVGVVGDVGQLYDHQVHRLVGFAGGVGGDAGERAGVFHRADQDVQRPVIVNQRPGGVGHQFALRRDPVDGWFRVASGLTPEKKNKRRSIRQRKVSGLDLFTLQEVK